MAKKQFITKQEREIAKLTVDAVVFNVIDGDLKILLIQRGIPPFKKMWALPGGHLEKGELLKTAAARELKEETGVKNIYLEQLYTFDDPKRDPRGRVISVAYFALIGAEPRLYPDTDAMATNWFSIKRLPKLAFDHKKIVNYALKRLRWKLEYSNIACNLLPKYFTLSELQEVYEIILAKKIDKRNFRKKIFALNLIESINKKKKEVSYRPPLLYKFKTKRPIVLAKREITF